MPKLRGFAKSMRHKPTEAEDRFWQILRHRRLDGHKFRRQHPVGNYILDFVCLSSHLIVELDGSQHADNAYDVARDTYLRAQGFRLLRFWNNDILARPEHILEAVWAALQEPMP
ncbi:endonuclease domain-containing protein [Devosia sp.]|uniref:endonuclease domain-containing protein n=1 Tax=Devosia sp. TaxID=1871048 RepID=UPI002635D6DE|nr:endonuclease domain-containing protein [Devosia sp.]